MFISGSNRISSAHQTCVSEQETEGEQDYNVHEKKREGGVETSGTELFGTARGVGWEIKSFFFLWCASEVYFFFCGVCKVCFFFFCGEPVGTAE